MAWQGPQPAGFWPASTPQSRQLAFSLAGPPNRMTSFRSGKVPPNFLAGFWPHRPSRSVSHFVAWQCAPGRLYVGLVGFPRQRRRLRLAEAPRAGAAAILCLGASRLSLRSAEAAAAARVTSHGSAAAAAARRSCPGSTETEPRHDGSGAEDGGAGGVRENGAGPGPGRGS